MNNNKITQEQAAAVAAYIEGKQFGESATLQSGNGLFVVIPVTLEGYAEGTLQRQILNHTEKGGTLLKTGYQGFVQSPAIPHGVWVTASAGLNMAKYNEREAIEAAKAAKAQTEAVMTDMIKSLKAAGIDAKELAKMLEKAAKQA